MKKLIIGVFALSVMLFSCSKEEAPKSIVSSTINQPLEVGVIKMRWFYDNGQNDGPDDFGCKGEGGKCFPDIVIVGVMAPNILDDLLNVIDNGTDNDVINIFIQYSVELGVIFNEEIMSNVLDGTFTVSYKGVNVSGEKVYILFSENDTYASIQPLVI